jgi:hypothetical protein
VSRRHEFGDSQRFVMGPEVEGLEALAAGAQVLTGGGADQFGYELLWGAILSGLAYWYLYGNARVRAYYRQLEGRGS